MTRPLFEAAARRPTLTECQKRDARHQAEYLAEALAYLVETLRHLHAPPDPYKHARMAVACRDILAAAECHRIARGYFARAGVWL
jgi:hypothetical protein